MTPPMLLLVRLMMILEIHLPTHRNHLDHKGDQEEQHQWLKSIKNLCAIAIEWVDEALYETNLRGNPREILGIYDKSTFEVENDGDFNEQGNYFINTPSSPCSYKKSPNSLSLSNIAPHDIFNPLMLPIPKDFERVVVDAYVYHKYCRSDKYLLEGKPLHHITS
jgi:hypothetical protein